MGYIWPVVSENILTMQQLTVATLVCGFLTLKSAHGITTGITPQGKPFACLPFGSTCPTSRAQNIIDPRIVTAFKGGLCPSGFFLCFGVDPQCGQRLVEPVKENDGNADKGAHPWQAFMRNLTHVFSGSGALLDGFHVLTAAHKVHNNRENPGELTVYMGVWDPNDLDDTQSSQVKEVVVHPLFDEKSLFNDIALLRLENPIVFGIHDNINTICVPDYGTNFAGSWCTTSGWGQTTFTSLDAPTSPQKQVRVPVVDQATCRKSFSKANLLGDKVDIYLDQIGELCAGGEASKDACSQDGGSPLTCPDSAGKLNVAGLVIWGKNCGQPEVYGVYVNVAFYSNWISTTIESLNAKYVKRRK